MDKGERLKRAAKYAMETPGRVCFSMVAVYMYDKLLDLVRQRLCGTDEPFQIVYAPFEGISLWGDQCSLDRLEDDYFDRYCYNSLETGFDGILAAFGNLLDGRVEPGESLYSWRVQEYYENNSERPGTEDPKMRSLCREALGGVDQAFFDAIPEFEDIAVEWVYDTTTGECGDARFTMSFTSRKAGAFLSWAKDRQLDKEVYRAYQLWDCVRYPLGSYNAYTGVKDGVFYEWVVVGECNGYYDDVSGIYSIGPDWYPYLVLFNDAVDRLNRKYGFYRKEEADDRVDDTAA